MSNTKITKTVNTPMGSYKEMKPLWEKMRTAVEGQHAVKKRDRKRFVSLAPSTNDAKKQDQDLAPSISHAPFLTPFSTTMTAASYYLFQDQSEWPSFISTYVQSMIASLLRSNPEIKINKSSIDDELKKKMHDFINNDFAGPDMPLMPFLGDLTKEEIITSAPWVELAYPNLGKKRISQAEKEKISPYPIIHKAENIINYQVSEHPVYKTRVLTRVIVASVVEVPDKDSPWHHDCAYEVKDYHLTTGSKLAVHVYRSDTPDGEYELKTRINPTINGKRLDYIPIWPVGGSYELVAPKLLPLVDKTIALYQEQSLYRSVLFDQADHTLVLHCDDIDPKQFNEMVKRKGDAWLVGVDDRVSIVDAPADSLGAFETRVQSGKMDLVRMGMRDMAPEVSEQSGAALRIRNANQSSNIGSINARVSSTMRVVISHMLNWKFELRGDDVLIPSDIDFGMIDDAFDALTPELLRLYSEWVTADLLSIEEFSSIVQTQFGVKLNQAFGKADIKPATEPQSSESDL